MAEAKGTAPATTPRPTAEPAVASGSPPLAAGSATLHGGSPAPYAGSSPDSLDSLLDRFAALVEERAIPLEPRFLHGGFPAVEADLAAGREEAKARGLWAPQLPGEWGGLGLPLADFARVAEVLGRSPLGHYLCNCQAPDAGNLEILIEFGSDEQQGRWLGPLARGELRSCFAMTEPDFPGSNPVWMGTTARRDGDDYVLDGRKWFASAADGAAFAVVLAVTDPDAPPHRRASLFIVPTDTPGYRLLRNIPVMGDAGAGWASHGEIRFDGCRVPAEPPPRRRGRRLRHRPGAAGPGAHPPLHALDRRRRARLRPDVPAGGLPPPGPRPHPRRGAGGAGLDRREPGGDRRRAPAGARHRPADRRRGRRGSGAATASR